MLCLQRNKGRVIKMTKSYLFVCLFVCYKNVHLRREGRRVIALGQLSRDRIDRIFVSEGSFSQS